MKKLMIAAAVVLAAVTVNAAACNWTGNSVALSKSTGAATAVTSYALYLFDNAVVSQSDMAKALASGDTSKFEVKGAQVATTAGIAVGTPATAARWNTTFGSYTAGDEYTFYTVILNNELAKADQFMITDTKTAKVPSSGNLQMGFGSQAQNSWTDMAPEPTSGLLMLLGVAGLALKRKQK